jgi:metal-responsive CopG/Arc/MetJ family transcriptional regulator
VSKLTISLPEELAETVRRAANREGTSVSAVIARELRKYDLHEQSRQAIAEYEAEHGKLTEEGGERVRAWLQRAGVEWPPSPSMPAH